MAIVRKAMHLDWRERAWLAEAAALHAAILLMIRFLPFGWVARLVRAIARSGGPKGPALPVASAVWAVKTVAAVLPRGSSCLTAALTAHVMLKRRGVDSRVAIGVANRLPTPLFHAWVECDGRAVIGGDTAERYRPLESCSATAANIANSTALAGNCRPVSQTL